MEQTQHLCHETKSVSGQSHKALARMYQLGMGEAGIRRDAT